MKSINKVRDEIQELKAILQMEELLGYYEEETLVILGLHRSETKSKKLERICLSNTKKWR
jgi:hypothetical protein